MLRLEVGTQRLRLHLVAAAVFDLGALILLLREERQFILQLEIAVEPCGIELATGDRLLDGASRSSR